MSNTKIAIIGLGYVGLPLAVEFGKIFTTIGFDTNEFRIEELSKAIDATMEVDSNALKLSKKLRYTSNVDDIKNCNVFIVTVPTPIDTFKRPDLKPLISASQFIGQFLKKDDLVIYESTVYPGATEEICVPILEKYSGLVFNADFFCGYSPERINPGDKSHRITDIEKVTSGSTQKTADLVDRLYQNIITAGTHKAASIKIAEASKVIENTQRDVNIALVNEFSIIFRKLNIDTEAVLKAAGTKWNFLPFRPGLVGGHCIGVDPYYLTHKAKEVGYHPKMILAGRSLNDSMTSYVVSQVAELMAEKNIVMVGSSVLVMGLTFKENCPDLRNSRVVEMVKEFEAVGCFVEVFDPWINRLSAEKTLDIRLVDEPFKGKYDATILAVAHDQFREIGINNVRAYGKKISVLYDIKYLFSSSEVDGRL